MSWCFSDFLTVDSGLSEAWVTILFTSVFHWTRRVVSLPSQALRVSVHTPLLLLALVSELLPRCSLLALMLELLTTSVFYGGSCFSSSSAASSAASSRRCLEAATSCCFLLTVAYPLGCFTFLCSKSVGVKTASLAKVGDGGITT